jgi:hypothetical protein
MADTKFAAQTLTNTGRSESTNSLVLRFVDADANTLTVSLPGHIAATMLVPILSEFSLYRLPAPGEPIFSKNVDNWRVGASDEEAKVIFQMNGEHPMAMTLDDAKKFCLTMADAIQDLEKRAPLTRQ